MLVPHQEEKKSTFGKGVSPTKVGGTMTGARTEGQASVTRVLSRKDFGVGGPGGVCTDQSQEP